MRKTGVYLDEAQSERLARLAREENRSQARAETGSYHRRVLTITLSSKRIAEVGRRMALDSEGC